jgi:hypothetical protein
LAERYIVRKTVNVVQLKSVGQRLIVLRFQIGEPVGRAVLGQPRSAVACFTHVDQFDRKPLITEMKTEVVSNANGINSDCGQTAAVFLKESHQVAASVLASPYA